MRDSKTRTNRTQSIIFVRTYSNITNTLESNLLREQLFGFLLVILSSHDTVSRSFHSNVTRFRFFTKSVIDRSLVNSIASVIIKFRRHAFLVFYFYPLKNYKS